MNSKNELEEENREYRFRYGNSSKKQMTIFTCGNQYNQNSKVCKTV